MMVVMYKTGTSLKTKNTPLGILNLELCFKKPLADTAITTWQQTTDVAGKNNIEVAKCNTWWDFAFILFYSLFLYALITKLSNYFTGGFSEFAKKLGKAAFLVAGLDVLENIGLFTMLNGNTSSTVVIITSVISAAKWLLVMFMALFIMLTAPLAAYSKVR